LWKLKKEAQMTKTFVEEFPKSVTKEEMDALCEETKKKVTGCESCTYKSDDARKLWVMTSVIKIVA
jgi:hypothetical protein